MAGSLNKVILIGNLGADPEIREMPDGTKMAKFSIATLNCGKLCFIVLFVLADQLDKHYLVLTVTLNIFKSVKFV